MPELTEKQIAVSLTQRIASGDKSAESEMVERYSRGLLFIIKHTCRETSTANDLAQDTWRIVLEKVRKGELRDASKLPCFIIQIGKNLCLMNYRKIKKEMQVYEKSVLDNDRCCTEPDIELDKVYTKSAVQKAVSEMTIERDRDLLNRYFIQENTKKEICNALRLDCVHFDRVLYRAKQRFKIVWQSLSV